MTQNKSQEEREEQLLRALEATNAELAKVKSLAIANKERSRFSLRAIAQLGFGTLLIFVIVVPWQISNFIESEGEYAIGNFKGNYKTRPIDLPDLPAINLSAILDGGLKLLSGGFSSFGILLYMSKKGRIKKDAFEQWLLKQSGLDPSILKSNQDDDNDDDNRLPPFTSAISTTTQIPTITESLPLSSSDNAIENPDIHE